MHVNIYDQDGATLYRSNVALEDAINTKWDADTYAEAKSELEKSGRYWLGGGAAPLLLLIRCDHE